MQISTHLTETGAIGQAAAGRAAHASEAIDIRKAAADFESVFINQMFQAMRKTVPQVGLLGQDSAGQTFREMLDQQWSQNIAQAGGLGLGEILYRQLTDGDRIAPAHWQPSGGGAASADQQSDDHAY